MAAARGQGGSPSSQGSAHTEDHAPGATAVLGVHGLPTRTMRPKTEPLWRIHDHKAQKSGQRGTIYWVGRSIVGEDGSLTGERTKGASYHGEWGDNKKNGYGVQIFPSGEKYEGQWGNGQRNGEGTFWAPVGKAQKLRKVYVGGWKDDKRHGRGTCFFKNGEFFQGSWDQGKMHGQGTLRYANGDLYVGEWYDNQRSGRGTLNKANGDCYEGFWLNDKREGSGSFFYAESGKVFVGEWANDLPKAGVYTQASPNPDQAGAVPVTSVLPPVRLAFPLEVLEGALAAVRRARKGFRAHSSPLDRLFTREETKALQGAFLAAARPNGTLGMAELQALCGQLGMEMSAQHLRELLVGSGFLREAATDAELSLGPEDFLRVVAVLLDEEANTDRTQGDQGGDSFAEAFWDDGDSDN